MRVHDFKDKELGKAIPAIPNGVYDMLNNQGWGTVGIDHDTAKFAARSILSWWSEMGQTRFPRARRLLITADGSGSNSHRSRLWKVSLQELADEMGLKLVVCHFPPGTSTTTKSNLTVRAKLDTASCETGIKVSDEELAEVNLESHETHSAWNYTITPAR